ncbi:hypothetical protein AC792_15585, partial [Arthrobacter sp. RIT-PI-e]|uniref:DNA-3-methyladenine glycosylase family protein n=1 Tax=Arthrobacter sp. RIT-PI-e TaxID=1681197 RepID=UPI00067617D9
AQTARTLLPGADRPPAGAALAAGVGSIRQFNDTLRQIFDLTPRQLRQSAGRAPAPTSAAGEPVTLTLTLPARLPYDDGIFRFLADRAVDGMELGSGSSYERILPLPGGPAWFRALAVEPRGNGGAALPVTVPVADLGDLPLLLGRIRRLFDLDADPVAVDAALAEDERLGALSAAVPGIRLPGTPDPYDLLVRALVEERRPRGAARAALSRLVRTGPSVDLPGTPLRRMFPTAEQLVEALPHHGAGIEPAGVLRAVAHGLLSGALGPGRGAGAAAVRAQLVAHPGISPWVAHQVLLRGLGDPDVHVTDAGTRAGWVRLGGRGGSAGDTASSDAVHLAMTAARPWRSYATVHLWRAAEGLSPGAAPPTGTAAERIRHTT